MSSNNTLHFRKAIDVLMNENTDYKKVCIALAQTNPKLFNKLVDDPNVFKHVEEWHREVKRHVVAERKVEGIKLIREKTGFGLKESKDILDCLQNHFAQMLLCRPYEYSCGRPALNGKQQEVYNLITRA